MPKNLSHRLNAKPLPDAESPEWTTEDFANSKRLQDLPQDLQRILTEGDDGTGTAPHKTMVALRLSPDVLAALRAMGKGWRSEVDDTLRRHFVKPDRTA